MPIPIEQDYAYNPEFDGYVDVGGPTPLMDTADAVTMPQRNKYVIKEGLGFTEDRTLDLGGRTELKTAQVDSPAALDVLSSSWSLDTTLGSMAAAPDDDYNYFDSTYNVYLDELYQHAPEPVQVQMEKAFNPKYAQMTYKAAMKELERRQTLEDAGGLTAAIPLAVSLADPIYWPFMLNPYVNYARAGKAVKAGAVLALESGYGEIAAEFIKQDTQYFRTDEETRNAVMGSFVIGAALGFAATKWLGKDRLNKASKDYLDHINGPNGDKVIETPVQTEQQIKAKSQAPETDEQVFARAEVGIKAKQIDEAAAARIADDVAGEHILEEIKITCIIGAK